MSVETEKFRAINNYLSMIDRKPKRDVKFFFLEEPHRFIVDGNKLRFLPISYHKYYVRHEFYVQVDTKEKIAKFYAFDRKSLVNNSRVNEISGTIPWDKDFEESVHNFFLSNIRELTHEQYTYTSSRSEISSRQNQFDRSEYNRNPIASQHSTPSGGWSFQSEDYKEREKILDKVRALQKDNKSSQIIDYVGEHIPSLLKRGKFTIVDDILRVLFPDKMPIPITIEILRLTESAKELKERVFFLSKVKDHINKVNPKRVQIALKQFNGDDKWQQPN